VGETTYGRVRMVLLDIANPAERLNSHQRNEVSMASRRTQNKGNQVYCQLYRMNYESFRTDIRSASETCLKHVLAASGYQAQFNRCYDHEVITFP